jgi:hypothetical protein
VTTTITRHHTDRQHAASSVEISVEELPEDLRLARENTQALWLVYTAEQSHAAWRTVDDPIANEIGTWDAVVRSMQAGAAHIAVGTAVPGTTVGAVIAEETMAWPATPQVGFLTAGMWLEALVMVMVCRDRERTDALCAMDPSQLQTPGTTTQPYLTNWAQAWQRLWNGDLDGASAALTQALAASEPGMIPPDLRDYFEHIDEPQIMLLGYYISQDQERFAKALTDAVELHKAWWSDPGRADDPRGLVAWGLLALACLARENDWEVPVESEYLPAGLLDGDWVGEYAT